MKKLISLLLTFAMLCSLLIVEPLGVSAETVVVDEQGVELPAITNVAMLLGEDITQRNFTWFSLDSGEGKITYEKVGNLVDGGFSENAMVAVATRDNRYGEYSYKTGYYQNSAVMTGLEPGETYVYQLSNGESKSEVYTINVADDDSTFSFAFGGDAQLGGYEDGTYDDEAEYWGRTLKQITTADEFDGIEFFMSAGDQIESASTDELIEAQYDIYLNHDELKTLPQVVVLGNHDNKTKGTHTHHFNQPNLDANYGAIYYGDKLQSANYYFVYNSMLVIGINLNTFDHDQEGTDEKDAMDRADAEKYGEYIQKVLEETKDNKDILWRVVLCHQSPYGSSYHGNYTYQEDAEGNPILTEDGYYTYNRNEQWVYDNIKKYLLPYFYEADIDLVLSGHDHSYTRTHIIKPVFDRESDYYTNQAIITPYEDGNYTFADGTTIPTFNQNWQDAMGDVYPNLQVTSKPVKVSDPDGLLWVTGATSSGTQVNNPAYHNYYAAVTARANTRQVSRIDVSPTSLKLNVYNLGTNKVEDISLVDTFEIERTGAVSVGGVSLENITIAEGKTKALVPDFSPAEPTNTNVTWVSDNQNVATVDGDGVVTAVSAGTANITVTTEDGGYTAVCTVTVIESVPVTAITMSETMEMTVGDIKTIKTEIAPSDATNTELAWTSSNEEIATVSANGSVTAKKHGEVVITATATDGSDVSANCTVTVGYIPSDRVLSETSLVMNVMSTGKLSVTQSPENASYKNLVWQSSNPAVVTVDQSGNLKAHKQGTAVISVVNEEGSVDCNVTVQGGTTFLQNMEDENYTALMSGAGVNGDFWNRVQEEDGNWVLEVNGANYDSTTKIGTVYSNQIYSTSVPTPIMDGGYVLDMDVKRMSEEGHQILNIRTNDENAVKSAYRIKLTSMEVGTWYDVKILLASSGVKAYYKKCTDTEWTQDAKYWNGTVWNVGQQGGSDTGNYMSIFPDEISTALTLEEAQKTRIRIDNIKVSSPVAVNGLTLEETEVTLDINEEKTLKPVFTPQNSTDTHVTYVSSDLSAVTVDKNGVIKGRMVGSATITATSADGMYTDTCEVTVYSSVKVEQVIVPENLEMTMGETKQISASVLPETAAGGVVWTSSDEEIATVDENGNVTALRHGEVVITATAVDGSGIKGDCKVTIGYVSSIRTLNKTSLEMTVLDKEQLVLTFNPENASYQEITWSSTDTSVASVDENGLVSANGQGTAVIKASTIEGEVSCNVTVQGGTTFLQDMEDENYTVLMSDAGVNGNFWNRVQEEDGNWVLEVNGANYDSTTKIGAVYSNLMSSSSIPTPSIDGGYVIDMDVKRMSEEGHQILNIRTNDENAVKSAHRIKLTSMEVGTWYDVKILLTSSGVEAYYKKCTDTEWTKDAKYWNGVVWHVGQKGGTGLGNHMAIFPDELTTALTLEEAQKTRIRIDNIKVSAPVVSTGIEFEDTTTYLTIGQTAELNPIFTPNNASDTNVVYVSSNPDVVTVSRLGKLTAVGEGTATITATGVECGETDTINVVVTAENVDLELNAVKVETESGFKFTVGSNKALDAQKIYVAAYDASDRMIGAAMENYRVDGTEIIINVSNASYFKVFAWDANAKAVAEAKTVE